MALHYFHFTTEASHYWVDEINCKSPQILSWITIDFAYSKMIKFYFSKGVNPHSVFWKSRIHMKSGMKMTSSRTTGYGRVSCGRMLGCSLPASGNDMSVVIPADLSLIRNDVLLLLAKNLSWRDDKHFQLIFWRPSREKRGAAFLMERRMALVSNLCLRAELQWIIMRLCQNYRGGLCWGLAKTLASGCRRERWACPVIAERCDLDPKYFNEERVCNEKMNGRCELSFSRTRLKWGFYGKPHRGCIFPSN